MYICIYTDIYIYMPRRRRDYKFDFFYFEYKDEKMSSRMSNESRLNAKMN